jgi:hypothetical protein
MIKKLLTDKENYLDERKNRYANRSGLEPKSLRDNRFYKGHRDIAEQASHHFKKASIPLKTLNYLNIFAILEKALISLKKSSKIIEIFIKAHNSKKKPPFLWKCLQSYVYNIIILIKKKPALL